MGQFLNFFVIVRDHYCCNFIFILSGTNDILMKILLIFFFLFSQSIFSQQSYIDYQSPFHPVVSNSGMVVSQNYLSSDIGIEILNQGGNAIDAAIAANAALGLMEPTGCGVGGDLFAIVWDAKLKSSTVSTAAAALQNL